MKPVILLLMTKIASFIGACLTTVGFLNFFFWESLEPFRWQMIVGGFALIAIAELASHFLLNKMKQDVEVSESSGDG